MSDAERPQYNGHNADAISVRDYFEARLRDMELRLQQRFDAQEASVTAAMVAAEKAVNAALCVSSDTPILCADLIWRPAGELQRGDELIAFDEEDPGTARGRRFRRATVIDNSLQQDVLLRVATTHGIVRCNVDHWWLARRRKGDPYGWIRTGALSPGMQVHHTVDVWEPDQSKDGGWLSGMFDGEGCLCFKNGTNGKARLSVVQRESDTAERIGTSLRSRLDVFGERHRPGTEIPRASPRVEFEINARADVMKILGSIRPPRLLAHADAVWEDFPIGGNNRTATVLAVETDSPGIVASLSTSTSTYIAGGFAMHNTASEKAVDKAEQAQALRNIVSNESRNTLAAQAATFWPIKEGQAAVTSLSNRTDEALVSLRRELTAQIGVEESRLIALERLASVGQGRLSAISMLWGVAAVIASLGLNLLWHFATH